MQSSETGDKGMSNCRALAGPSSKVAIQKGSSFVGNMNSYIGYSKIVCKCEP